MYENQRRVMCASCRTQHLRCLSSVHQSSPHRPRDGDFDALCVERARVLFRGREYGVFSASILSVVQQRATHTAVRSKPLERRMFFFVDSTRAFSYVTAGHGSRVG